MTLQGELPYNEEVFDAMCRRLQSLEELSGGPIPALQKTQSALEEKFVRTAELADTLDDKLKEYKVGLLSFYC